MGPLAPRRGGRRPRRRLCFPPPAEGCPGPAFIGFLLLVFEANSRHGIAGPVVSCFTLGRLVQVCATAHQLPADQHPTSAGCYSRTMFKLFQFWAPGVLLARTASLEAWPLGTILMLLMKPPTAQGGSTLSFPHSPLYQNGTSTFRHSIALTPISGMNALFLAPRVSRRFTLSSALAGRCTKGETRPRY
jgi:hypothetical protein